MLSAAKHLEATETLTGIEHTCANATYLLNLRVCQH